MIQISTNFDRFRAKQAPIELRKFQFFAGIVFLETSRFPRSRLEVLTRHHPERVKRVCNQHFDRFSTISDPPNAVTYSAHGVRTSRYPYALLSSPCTGGLRIEKHAKTSTEHRVCSDKMSGPKVWPRAEAIIIIKLRY